MIRSKNKSLDPNKIANCSKAPVTDSAHNDEMFGTAKGPKLFAVIDDALSQALSDSGQRFQFVR